MQGTSAPGSPRGNDRRWRRALAAILVLMTLAMLGSTLWYVGRESGLRASRSPDRTPERPVAPAPVPSPAAALGPNAPLRVLEERVSELERGRAALEKAQSALENELASYTALRRLARRVSALEQQLKEAASLPPAEPSRPAGNVDLEPLRARIYKLEIALAGEGRARLETQDKLAARIFNIEKQRDASEAERQLGQKTLQERAYNAEQRIHELEESVQELQRVTHQRLDRLERLEGQDGSRAR